NQVVQGLRRQSLHDGLRGADTGAPRSREGAPHGKTVQVVLVRQRTRFVTLSPPLLWRESYEDNTRNESKRLSCSETDRHCRRVARPPPPPRRQLDLSTIEKNRARCIPGESSHADLRGQSLLSRFAIDSGWGRRSGDHHAA